MIRKFSKKFKLEKKKKITLGPNPIAPVEYFDNDSGKARENMSTQTPITSMPATFIPAPFGYGNSTGTLRGFTKRAKEDGEESWEFESSSTPEMEEFFKERTKKHIDLVNKYLDKLKEHYDYEFKDAHDNSKYADPEHEPYLYITWKHKMKDEGEDYEIPEEWKDKCDEATFHHIKNNKHHPEYWDDTLTENPINKEDRDKPSGKIVDATKMPEEYVLEMVADWCAMSEEKGNTPKEWADENIGVRWKFSPEQKDLIYEAIDTIWKPKIGSLKGFTKRAQQTPAWYEATRQYYPREQIQILPDEFYKAYAAIHLTSGLNLLPSSPVRLVLDTLENFANKLLKVGRLACHKELYYCPHGSAEEDNEYRDRIEEYFKMHGNLGELQPILDKIKSLSFSFDELSLRLQRGEYVGAYCGKAWANIAQELSKLEKMLPVSLSSAVNVALQIDHVVDMIHNNDAFLEGYVDKSLLDEKSSWDWDFFKEHAPQMYNMYQQLKRYQTGSIKGFTKRALTDGLQMRPSSDVEHFFHIYYKNQFIGTILKNKAGDSWGWSFNKFGPWQWGYPFDIVAAQALFAEWSKQQNLKTAQVATLQQTEGETTDSETLGGLIGEEVRNTDSPDAWVQILKRYEQEFGSEVIKEAMYSDAYVDEAYDSIMESLSDWAFYAPEVSLSNLEKFYALGSIIDLLEYAPSGILKYVFSIVEPLASAMTKAVYNGVVQHSVSFAAQGLESFRKLQQKVGSLDAFFKKVHDGKASLSEIKTLADASQLEGPWLVLLNAAIDVDKFLPANVNNVDQLIMTLDHLMDLEHNGGLMLGSYVQVESGADRDPLTEWEIQQILSDKTDKWTIEDIKNKAPEIYNMLQYLKPYRRAKLKSFTKTAQVKPGGSAEESKHSYEKQSRESIVEALLRLNTEEDLSYSNIRTKYPTLMANIRRYFSTYEEALREAGIDYTSHRKVRVPYTKEEVIAYLIQRKNEGQPIHAASVISDNGSLFNAAVRFFGSYDEALEAAGFNAEEIRPLQSWTPDLVIQKIRERYEDGQSLASSDVQKNDKALIQASLRYFDDWSNAVAEAGFNYAEIKRGGKRWTSEEILSTIKQYATAGLNLNYSAVDEINHPLVEAGQRYFESWRNAVEAAGEQYTTLRGTSLSEMEVGSIIRDIVGGENFKSNIKRIHYPGRGHKFYKPDYLIRGLRGHWVPSEYFGEWALFDPSYQERKSIKKTYLKNLYPNFISFSYKSDKGNRDLIYKKLLNGGYIDRQGKSYLDKTLTAQIVPGSSLMKSPQIEVDPIIREEIKDAVQILQAADPNYFKGVSKIVALHGGPYGQVSSEDPSVVHLNVQRIIAEVKSKFGTFDLNNPEHREAMEEAVQRVLIEVISHEKGHTLDWDPEKHQFPGGEGVAQQESRKMVQRIFPQGSVKGFCKKAQVDPVWDNFLKKYWPIAMSREIQRIKSENEAKKLLKEPLEKEDLGSMLIDVWGEYASELSDALAEREWPAERVSKYLQGLNHKVQEHAEQLRQWNKKSSVENFCKTAREDGEESWEFESDSPKHTFGIDIDGTIADTRKVMVEIIKQYVPVEEQDSQVYKIEEFAHGSMELKDKIFATLYEQNLITDIPPLPGAVEKINEMFDKGHKIVLITARPRNWEQQTQEWLKKIGLKYHKLIHARDKGKAAKEEGVDIFIDDEPPNIEDVGKEGIQGYLFDQPWNKEVAAPRIKSWKQVKAQTTFIRTCAVGEPSFEDQFDFYRSFTPEQVEKIQNSEIANLFQEIEGGEGIAYLFLDKFVQPGKFTRRELYESIMDIISRLLQEPVHISTPTCRLDKNGKIRDIKLSVKFGPQNPDDLEFLVEESKGPQHSIEMFSEEREEPEDPADWWKRSSDVEKFTKSASPRWSPEEKVRLKELYLKYRQRGIPHHIIYKAAAYLLNKSWLAVKQKLESMYDLEDDLQGMKFEHWDKDKIDQAIQDLYRGGKSISRLKLPPNLMYQITNHSMPKSQTRNFSTFYDSFDEAVANAILAVGFEREGDKLTEKPIKTIEDAIKYYRRKEKMCHTWDKDEVVQLLQEAHTAGLPLTYSFFRSHPDIYKPLLGVGRSLEGLRDSIKRLGYDWSSLVVEAVPEYSLFYDDNNKLKHSTEELRVYRFLELNNIPFRVAGDRDKLAVEDPELQLLGYRNFIPDFIITGSDGNVQAYVEVFGSIADSRAANTSELYREKKKAKEKFYSTLPYKFIAINNNTDGIDLTDEILKEKFGSFLGA